MTCYIAYPARGLNPADEYYPEQHEIRTRQDGFTNQMRHILSSLSAPALILPVPSVPSVPKHAEFNAILAELATPMTAPVAPVETTDCIHLTAGSYAKWKANLQAAADTFICPKL